MNSIMFSFPSAVRRCLKPFILFSLISSIVFFQLPVLWAEECPDKGGGGSHQGGTDSGGGGSLNVDMGVDGAMSRPAGMGGDSFGMSGPPDDFSRAARNAFQGFVDGHSRHGACHGKG